MPTIRPSWDRVCSSRVERKEAAALEPRERLPRAAASGQRGYRCATTGPRSFTSRPRENPRVFRLWKPSSFERGPRSFPSCRLLASQESFMAISIGSDTSIVTKLPGERSSSPCSSRASPWEARRAYLPDIVIHSLEDSYWRDELRGRLGRCRGTPGTLSELSPMKERAHPSPLPAGRRISPLHFPHQPLILLAGFPGVIEPNPFVDQLVHKSLSPDTMTTSRPSPGALMGGVLAPASPRGTDHVVRLVAGLLYVIDPHRLRDLGVLGIWPSRSSGIFRRRL